MEITGTPRCPRLKKHVYQFQGSTCFRFKKSEGTGAQHVTHVTKFHQLHTKKVTHQTMNRHIHSVIHWYPQTSWGIHRYPLVRVPQSNGYASKGMRNLTNGIFSIQNFLRIITEKKEVGGWVGGGGGGGGRTLFYQCAPKKLSFSLFFALLKVLLTLRNWRYFVDIGGCLWILAPKKTVSQNKKRLYNSQVSL